MITKAEKLALVVSELDDRRFHVYTMKFFEDNNELFNGMSPTEEGIVDGMFRAFAYMEKREQEQRDHHEDDCVSIGECV